MKLSALCALLAVALVIPACEKPSAPPNGAIAFLDLDAAAKRLGLDVALADKLKTENDTLVGKLLKERDELQAKFDELRQSAGEKPSDEDLKKLQDTEQSINAKLQTRQQEAREELRVKQADLIRQFREEIKPVAEKVAAARGMKTVLIRSELVAIAVDPAADITDEVVAQMAGPEKAAATPSASPSATP